jgi:signal transduction histidine kinase
MFTASPKQKVLLTKAEYYLSTFIKKSRDANDIMSVAQGLQKMADAEALAGDYQKAYEYSSQYHAINDSVFSQDNKNKIASLESRDEVEKKNHEIAEQKLQVQEERRNIVFLVSGLTAAVLIGFLFYRLSTVRKQQNNRLNKLNSELDEANKLKDRFFGILSHDLRTPVSNLINFLTLRQKKPGALSEQQVAEHENKMGKAAQTLLETMENLLLWSKSQMQYFKPEMQPVPVATLYKNLQNNFANEEQIHFVFTDEQHAIINTDENFVKTIMYNLTANAVKALRNIQHAKIEWCAWAEGNRILLSITDNGPGIDKSKINALYDETSISSARHGMGLHIIRDLSKAIGCSIQLNENVLSGTQFILTFAMQQQ